MICWTMPIYVSFYAHLYLLALFFQQVLLDEIRKSPNDNRKYRYVKLQSNGLATILISDKNADGAAAALQVAVGSFTEPSEYLGLAHYLEHILFLGTKKYPHTGDFNAFVNQQGGGYNNAFTGNDRTVFYFQVTSKCLEPAMDRHAEFFVNPLFDKDFLDKERSAVDAEFNKRVADETDRFWAVMKQLTNPLHPFSRFSIGNAATLPGGNKANALREMTMQFYATYYTLNRMTLENDTNLGVGGPQSLDELQAMAERTYGRINRRSWDGNGRLENGELVTLFPYGNLRRQIEVRTVSDTQYLELLFTMPDLYKYYRSKPASYVDAMITALRRGSLL